MSVLCSSTVWLRSLYRIGYYQQHRWASSQVSMREQLLRDTGASIPVFCGPMYPGSNPELVAEVSRCGGFGIVQPLSMTHLYEHNFRDGLRLIKKLSENKPFGVNFTIMPNKKYQKMMEEWMEISLEEGVKFFLTSLGKPDAIVRKAHAHGVKVYHDVHSSELARRAADAGVDGLNLLNCDMGGQTGVLSADGFLREVQTLDLGIPLLCAGGIGDENDFRCALTCGYAGVQMGTRFLATPECRVAESYKAGIVAAGRDDIVHTNKLAGTESSVISTPTIRRGGLRVNPLLGYLLKNPRTKGYARMFLLSRAVNGYKKVAFEEGHDIWQAGRGVGTIHAIEPVADILARFERVLAEQS